MKYNLFVSNDMQFLVYDPRNKIVAGSIPETVTNNATFRKSNDSLKLISHDAVCTTRIKNSSL